MDPAEPSPDAGQEPQERRWLQEPVSRRSLLASTGLAGVGALAAGTVAGHWLAPEKSAGAATPSATKPPSPQPLPDRTFASTALTTPHVTNWSNDGVAEGLLFATPQGAGSAGVILDGATRPVWMEPSGAGVMDLRVQTFEGKPVLTYWQGTAAEGGHGAGQGLILDTSYRTLATVSAGAGMDIDLHEFRLTAAGTALLIAYPTVPADLGPVGGPANGFLFDCHVQEIHVRSGALLLDWTASDHIPLTDSYAAPGGPLAKDGTSIDSAYDPFHLNSVEDRDDTLLVSARHTSAVYLIDRTSGTIRWQLGGKKSDFAVAKDAAFAWQHDARWRGPNTLSVFDNHFAEGTDGSSRGLFLTLDHSAKTATLDREFTHAGHGGNAEGNVQLLPNGNVLVGWGADPTATEFLPDGTAVFEAAGIGNGCYRVYRFPWTARPHTLPSMALRRGAGASMQVFASWNGATDVSAWRALTGLDSSRLSATATVRRTGFETSFAVRAQPYACVQALDADGTVLATSAITSL